MKKFAHRHVAVTAVVAVHNGAATLDRCLRALAASELPREALEIIVVDENSSDASAAIAARYADTVVRLATNRRGSAYARNRGAELASGDVIAFVDSDVLVRAETLPRMVGALKEQPELDAIAATRDAGPTAPNFVSQYWNLLLHYGERKQIGPAGNFAAGCAMIRRSTFFLVGMFDEWRFSIGNLEGIELGQRLESGGHEIRFSSDLQVLPLKSWRARSAIKEVWDRTVLLTRSLGYRHTLATAPGEVVFTLTRAAVPMLAMLPIALLSAGFFQEPRWLLSGAIILVLATLINFRLLRFFARERGLLFAIAALPVHLFYQLIGATAICVGWLMGEAVGDRLPDAATQAYAEVGVDMWPPVPRPR